MNTRRDFIQKLGLTALALQLTPAATWAGNIIDGDSNYDGLVLRVALMGLGVFANRVAEAMAYC